MSATETFTAGEGDAGRRLDAVVGDRVGSRSKAQALIAAGLVTVDGALVAKRHAVQRGERIEIAAEQRPQAPDDVASNTDVPVVYEDRQLIVVDKPPGLVVHPAPGHPTGTLVQLLSDRAGGGEGWRAGLVHRLDRDTSGLLVLAKDDHTHAQLKQQIQDRSVARTYVALVEGVPSARSGTVDAPIGRDRRVRTRHSTDTATPREARTHFELRELIGAFSLLEVRLETGRTHQIRVHLEAIGHPVVGDPVYGRAGLLGLERQFLHASRLAFEHPLTGEALEFTSELPVDLSRALDVARTDVQQT